MTRAHAHHDSPQGRIEVEWTIQGDQARISVAVPHGTECDLELPDGTLSTLGPGDHERTWLRS